MKNSNWPPNHASSIHFISLYYASIQISQFQSLFIFSLNCYLHHKQLCFVIKSHCQNGSNNSIWRGKRGLHLLLWHCRGVSNKNSNPKHKHLSTTAKYINVQINNITQFYFELGTIILRINLEPTNYFSLIAFVESLH